MKDGMRKTASMIYQQIMDENKKPHKLNRREFLKGFSRQEGKENENRTEDQSEETREEDDTVAVSKSPISDRAEYCQLGERNGATYKADDHGTGGGTGM